jgi:endonuclease YncB( thermonuclease family)
MIRLAPSRRSRPRVLPGAVFVCALLRAATILAGPESLPERLNGPAEAVTGDRLRIADLPQDVRLAGILAPQGRDDPLRAPFARAARDGLERLLAGRTVSLRVTATAEDRAGRLRAHVLRDDGLWLQAELVRRGLVRVAAAADAAEFVDDLLVLEAEARKADRGLWALPAYRVRDAADVRRLDSDIGSYQLVAGTVVAAARRGDAIYLDFGEDYRSDMTAIIPRDAWPRFNALKPLGLAGKRIRVRGWLMRRGGPAVELTVPAFLERLD